MRRSKRSGPTSSGFKGPLTTRSAAASASLNVALRQLLDLYVCLRPVRWFRRRAEPGEEPGPGRHGHLPREHRGHLRRIEFESGSADAKKLLSFIEKEFPKDYKKIRFPGDDRDSGSSPYRRTATERLVRAAIEYAILNQRKSVTFVHKGNIMKFTEGPS